MPSASVSRSKAVSSSRCDGSRVSLSLCSLDGNLFPFSSVSKEGSEIVRSSYLLRPTCHCFVFDPIVTRLHSALLS